MDTGKLYLCGTPIGNLEDITLRTLRTLKEVNVIYAEDTRHTIKLLNYYEISKPIHSYHEHNKVKVTPEIVDKLRKGEQIALVSDAGMPGISDPGADLIKVLIEHGMSFEIIPGPTALISALVGSGMDTTAFVFVGFLSRDKKTKKKSLESLKYERKTLIIYESPHRFKETLKFIFEILGNRNMTLARELTKKFESYERNTVLGMIEHYEHETVKGEIVIVLEGSYKEAPKESDFRLQLSVLDHLQFFLDQEMDKKEAIKIVAKERHMKKSEVYKYTIDEQK